MYLGRARVRTCSKKLTRVFTSQPCPLPSFLRTLLQPSSRGFKEAKRLLQRHYGDELIIARAYIDKALKWPQTRSDDGKALSAYSLFLICCRNTFKNGESMEEMDNPTNIRAVISKLPYKMKERW